jgi:hypothetical protein
MNQVINDVDPITNASTNAKKVVCKEAKNKRLESIIHNSSKWSLFLES